ncbi:hypothetical protein FRACYDRAFT_249032 [Fragilariopsis cylindrus CCMP1102]|uniref:Uncharacterized protein n=1 Tax=Fragilariopsis cylindrus CCMP1102 TaxID=635003 RepID=A0A1E7ETC3_9STRA|nr:hypothetical protein FRACYDRAFT_249032 [Fragilariopsis cylindrus CCMP1102]|eukprot:OEU09119.1 hypothetical protein FRACYDRAFT_249032 [Fragilariopsis cylindrus CCMP1102]
MNSFRNQVETTALDTIEEEIMLPAVPRRSSSRSVRFMEEAHAHAHDPSQRSTWKPTTSSKAASIAPPAFLNRRSSLEFNNNCIDDDKLKPSVLPSIIKKGGNNHGDIITEKGKYASNKKRWTSMTTTTSSKASIAPPAFVNRRSNSMHDNRSVWETTEIRNSLRSLLRATHDSHALSAEN